MSVYLSMRNLVCVGQDSQYSILEAIVIKNPSVVLIPVYRGSA